MFEFEIVQKLEQNTETFKNIKDDSSSQSNIKEYKQKNIAIYVIFP